MSNSPETGTQSLENDPKPSLIEEETARAMVDEEPLTGNQRDFTGARNMLIACLCVAYTVFHLLVMNVFPLETWTYRLSHVGGGLFLGFLLFGANSMDPNAKGHNNLLGNILLAVAGAGIIYGAASVAAIWINGTVFGEMIPPKWAMSTFGIPLAAGTALAIVYGWLYPQPDRSRFSVGDILLGIAAITCTAYLIFFARQLQLRAGMPMALPGDMWGRCNRCLADH